MPDLVDMARAAQLPPLRLAVLYDDDRLRSHQNFAFFGPSTLGVSISGRDTGVTPGCSITILKVLVAARRDPVDLDARAFGLREYER